MDLTRKVRLIEKIVGSLFFGRQSFTSQIMCEQRAFQLKKGLLVVMLVTAIFPCSLGLPMKVSKVHWCLVPPELSLGSGAKIMTVRVLYVCARARARVFMCDIRNMYLVSAPTHTRILLSWTRSTGNVVEPRHLQKVMY